MANRVLDSTDALIFLLEKLKNNVQEQGVRSLGDSIVASKSTVHRLLQSMSANSWVFQDKNTKNYYIGLRFLCLADEWRQNLKLVRFADPFLQSLAHRCGQTIALNILNKGRALCVHKIEALSVIRIASRIGHEYPLHAGASGKSVLAYSPKALIDSVLSSQLPAYTPYTVTDPKILSTQIEEIKKSKYCISREEIDPGVAAIASPVLNNKGDLLFVVTIAGTHFEIEQNLNNYIRDLLDTTFELEKHINE